LDTGEGLLKIVDDIDIYFGGKADLIFKNARYKVRMRKFCEPLDGIPLSRFVHDFKIFKILNF
jgi:hypothetical protein